MLGSAATAQAQSAKSQPTLFAAQMSTAPQTSSLYNKFKRMRKKDSEHVHLTQSFDATTTSSLFVVKGSAMLSRPVVLRSLIASALSQCYYVFNEMRPDKALEGVSIFYFLVLGSILSFLVVFKSSIAYGRVWEARSHIGTICHASRCVMRKLLFSTNLRAGDPEVEEAVNNVQRYLRAFFILMMQDVRTTHDLERVPADVLPHKEKQARPYSWCQLDARLHTHLPDSLPAGRTWSTRGDGLCSRWPGVSSCCARWCEANTYASAWACRSRTTSSRCRRRTMVAPRSGRSRCPFHTRS